MRRINRGLAYIKAKRSVKDYYTNLTKQNNEISKYNSNEIARAYNEARAYVDNKNKHRTYKGNDKNSPNWSLGRVRQYARFGPNGYIGFGVDMGDKLRPGDRGYKAQQAKLNQYIMYRHEYTESNRSRGISGQVLGDFGLKHKDNIEDKWKGLSNKDKRDAELYNLYNQDGEMPEFYKPEAQKNLGAISAQQHGKIGRDLIKQKLSDTIKKRRPDTIPVNPQPKQGIQRGISKDVRIQSLRGLRGGIANVKNKQVMINSNTDDDEKKTRLIGKSIK